MCFIEKYSREEFLEMLNNCMTIADFCRKLNLKPTGGNYRALDLQLSIT